MPKLLRVMQASRQPLLRASVALCFRQLARDGHMRQQLASAGAIPALSLLLQSPSSIARQAAARAISNLVVNCGEWLWNYWQALRAGACLWARLVLYARHQPWATYATT